jgi:hypothetical protein
VAGSLLAASFGLVLGTMARSFIDLSGMFVPLLLGGFLITFISGYVMKSRWAVLVAPGAIWAGAVIGMQIMSGEMRVGAAEAFVVLAYLTLFGCPIWAAFAGLGVNAGSGAVS